MFRKACGTLAILLLLCCQAGAVFGQAGSIKPGQSFSVRILGQPDVPILVKIVPTNGAPQASYIFSATDRLPGTSHSVDYGRFYRNVQAFNKDDQSLAVHRIGTNQWQIYDGGNFAYLTYEVALHEIEGVLKNPLFSGTLRAGYTFTPCLAVLGWLHGHENGIQRLNIERPTHWQLATNLQAVSHDEFLESNFSQMSSGFLATGEVIRISQAIAFHVPHFSTLFRDAGFEGTGSTVDFHRLTQTAAVLFEHAPFEKYYTFLQYVKIPYRNRTKASYQASVFDNGQHMVILSEKMSTDAVQEALLTHYLQAWLSDKRYFKSRVKDFYMQRSDYSEWLMAGLSQYYAARLLAQTGATSQKRLLSKIAEWANAERKNQAEFTAGATTAGYSNGYVHQQRDLASRGALIGFLLDVQILYQSRGFKRLDHGLQNLEKTFLKTGKKMHISKLPNLIDDATSISVQQFFQTYIDQPTPLPLEKAFESLGLRPSFQIDATVAELEILPDAKIQAQARQLREWWLKKIDLH